MNPSGLEHKERGRDLAWLQHNYKCWGDLIRTFGSKGQSSGLTNGGDELKVREDAEYLQHAFHAAEVSLSSACLFGVEGSIRRIY